ncbi:MAG: ATP-binding cassette domain-containing protein [Acidimicrobiaceae bacterium]|nr:ATP-binding cassette domain-containing protein [Acidimicrobiaceae bacterium]
MLPEGPLGLEIEDLAVGYGSRLVLDGVSLRVRPGETVALVGATGSGKSTLLETVAGLNDLERGSIRLSGTDLGSLGSGELHEAVALVFQEAFLFADSVVENVDMKRGRGPAAVTGALGSAAAGAFVDALPDGAATVVGERGVTLSGGQRQRVALARALVRSPRLLMLDDATSAVDPVVESEILANLRGGLDTTLLVVAHRISTIELADRVAYLAGGRIAATGTHEELLALDDYRSLVSAYEQAAAPEAERVGGDSR